jgi:GAF domain-containing protein
LDSKLITKQIKISETILDKWQSIVNDLAEFMKVEISFITNIRDEILEFVSVNQSKIHSHKKGEIYKLKGLFCEKTIALKSYHLVPNALTDPEWNKSAEMKYGFISYLGFPLHWPNGDIYGTLCVNDRKQQDYSPFRISIMEHFKDLLESQLSLLYKNFELNYINLELRDSLEQIKYLKKLLPICSKCKKIRDDSGKWHQLEIYIREKTGTQFTHGLCNECSEILLNDLETY